MHYIIFEGSVFEENNNDGTRGVIYGYDDHKVRIWGENIYLYLLFFFVVYWFYLF